MQNPYLLFRENIPTGHSLGNPTGDPNLADAVVAFDFGDGGRYPDNGFNGSLAGELRPGFANTAIAKYIKQNFLEVSHYDKRQQRVVWRAKVAIYAQTLVGQVLQEQYGLEENDMFTIVGKPTEEGNYIDSWAVAVEAQQHITERQQPMGKIAVAAVQQHAGRVRWQTQQAFKMKDVEAPKPEAKVFIPAGLPKTYADPDSTQKWTTGPLTWWPREMATRALAWIEGGPTNPEAIKAIPRHAVGWMKKKLDQVTSATLKGFKGDR